jgi:hypothetical protein
MARGWAVIDAAPPPLVLAAASPLLLRLDDGTASNALALRLDAAGPSLQSVLSGSQSAKPAVAGVPAGASFRAGIRWDSAASSLALFTPYGSAWASAAVPSGLAAVRIGAASGEASLNGRVRGVWAGGGAPSDAQMLAALRSDPLAAIQA